MNTFPRQKSKDRTVAKKGGTQGEEGLIRGSAPWGDTPTIDLGGGLSKVGRYKSRSVGEVVGRSGRVATYYSLSRVRPRSSHAVRCGPSRERTLDTVGLDQASTKAPSPLQVYLIETCFGGRELGLHSRASLMDRPRTSA